MGPNTIIKMVKRFGDGAHITIPKKYIGKTVEIIIK